MKNDFGQMIKNIENEILNLKTASEYASIRSAEYTASISVSTGLYRITYNNDGEPIFSFCYIGTDISAFGIPYARTPENNSQIIEVLESNPTTLVVISNVPVISITRI